MSLHPKDYRRKGERAIDARGAWGTTSPFTEGTKSVDLNIHPEQIAFTPQCKETCIELRKTIGNFTAQDMENYRLDLNIRKMEASAAKNVEAYEAASNETACLTAWTKCEVELTECLDDCIKIRHDVGESNIKDPAIVAAAMQSALSVAEDSSRTRNEIVDATRTFNCITRYNELCVPKK